MKTLRVALIAAMLFSPAIATAEVSPRRGTFFGYPFVDRWGQAMFGSYLIDEDARDQLAARPLEPMRITTEQVLRTYTEGLKVIRQLSKVEEVSKPPIEMKLTLDKQATTFGQHTRLHLLVTNNTEEPISLESGSFRLHITIQKRGHDPTNASAKDQQYDWLRKSYEWRDPRQRVARASLSHPLYPQSESEQRSIFGYLRPDGANHAGTYDESRRLQTIPAKGFVESVFQVGESWLVNEYELQAQCSTSDNDKLSVPYVISPPVAFDITAD